ncbi:cytosine permease [Streptomyces tubercidicus]|uniref:cytosine permease n=1 Tax=Streptomyces tubercidicus TaxID=47759 RepID=UPI0036B250B5
MTDRHGAAQPGAVEPHIAYQVPEYTRHGFTRALCTLGFGTPVAPLSLVTGAMAVQVLHQPLWAGVLAVLVGQLLGAVCTAPHGAPGWRPAVPRMLRHRARFDSPGALPGVAVAAAVYAVFFAAHLALAGRSLHVLAPGLPAGVGILLAAAGSALLCLIGHRHRLIPVLNEAAAVILGLGSMAALAVVVTLGLPLDFLTRGGFTFPGWLATVALSALWQPAVGPYAADPSRLPRSVRTTAAFPVTYGGRCLGSLLPFVAGAALALGPAGGFGTRFAGPALVVLAVLVSWAAVNGTEYFLWARSRRRCEAGAVLGMREQAARILDPLRPLYPEDVRGFADTR